MKKQLINLLIFLVACAIAFAYNVSMVRTEVI